MGEADLNLAVRDYSKPIVPIFQGKEGFCAYVQIVTTPPTKFDADAAKKKAAEREMIRMRQDAQIDWKTVVNSERLDERISTLADLVRDGFLPLDIAAQRAQITAQEFAVRAGIKL